MYEFLNTAGFRLKAFTWWTGLTSVDENEEFDHRISSMYELDYIIKSNGGQILIDGRPYDCRPDTIIFRGPGHHVAGKGRYESFYMGFYIDSKVKPVFPIVTDTLSPKLYTLMYEMFNVYRDADDPLREFNIQRIFYNIFGEMSRSRPELSANASKDMAYSAAAEYINSHSSEKLTLDKIALMTGVSKYTLCRIVKEKVGISLFDYIEIIRVNNAAVLLNEKKKTIKEACFESGFKSMPTFFRAFKKVTGKTPSEYRQHADGMIN